MPISSVGRASRSGATGITLIEMMIVVMLISLMASISFPSVSAGIDTMRLNSATDSLAAFLNGALNRAERRQEAIEVTISPRENSIVLYSTEPGFERRLAMPAGVTIQAVMPEVPGLDTGLPRQFLLTPGARPPRIGIRLGNGRGRARIVRVDPVTGVPRVEAVL